MRKKFNAVIPNGRTSALSLIAIACTTLSTNGNTTPNLLFLGLEYIPSAILTSKPSVVNSDKTLPTNSVWYSGKQRFVFNIKGNDSRLVALIKIKIKMVYIRFIGTHKDYDNEHYPIGAPSRTGNLHQPFNRCKHSARSLLTSKQTSPEVK